MSGIVNKRVSITFNTINWILHKPKFTENLQENLKIGNEVLCEFRKEFGYPHSDTYAGQIKYNGNNSKYSILHNRIEDVISEYYIDIMSSLRTIPHYDKNIKNLTKNVMNTNAANCYEQSYIIQNKLIQRGINAIRIATEIENADNKRYFTDHVFVAFGFDEISNLNKAPKYWGKNVVVVDSWANIVASAADWEKQIHKFMKIHPYEKLFIEEVHNNPLSILSCKLHHYLLRLY